METLTESTQYSAPAFGKRVAREQLSSTTKLPATHHTAISPIVHPRTLPGMRFVFAKMLLTSIKNEIFDKAIGMLRKT